MVKAKTVYEEKAALRARYSHPKSDDFLLYITHLKIKNSGNNPIQIQLHFDGIYPYAAPMPPEQHTIKASSIMELHLKLVRWFKKYGYELYDSSY